VLTSWLAGTWYEADPTALRKELDGYLAASGEKVDERVRALILPHAGYRYSGPTAAHGARVVQGRTFRRVIVMGPSHRVPLRDVVSMPKATLYATPLGEIPLDVDFLAALERYPVFQRIPAAHRREHSVQIELPLLQVALGSFELVPLVVGDLDSATTKKVAEILLGLIDDDTLVVASSDFTHYGSQFGYVPFDHDIFANLKKLDQGAWAFIEKLDADGFRAYLEKTGATICGRRPIEILLRMLPQDTKALQLAYDTSGRLTDDEEHSVSYMAIAFETHWPEREPSKAPAEAGALTKKEQAILLDVAHRAIPFALEKDRVPALKDLGVEVPERLMRPQGVFVTLRTKDGDLRGCIGQIFPRAPLAEAVVSTAVGAALRDNRFFPVTEDEWPGLTMEISVLTPPEPVASWKDIHLGRDGMVLRKAGRSAVFLPQVAPEQGWDIEQTLTRLAIKAGLGPDQWRKGASFLVFQAQVFGEGTE